MPSHEPFEVRSAIEGERFFRIVPTETPRVEDFSSDAEAGRHRTLRELGSIALYRGFSVRATLSQARGLAALLRHPYVAEIALTPEEGDDVARTLRTRGHHTLWVEAESVRRRVVAIHGVAE